MRSFRLEDLTWQEVKAALQGEVDTVVFAVGSTEQHGPHLPLASDTLIGEWLADSTAQRLQRALVAPVLPVGCSQHHIAFAGTISIEPATLHSIVVSYCQTLLGHGFRRVVIIPSHGGNFGPVASAVKTLRELLPDKQIVSFCDLNRLVEVSHSLSREFGVSPGASGAHAGEYETSILLYLRPDLVDMKRAEEGFIGDLTPMIQELFTHGLAKVTANGVLGDGRLGDGNRGKRYLEAWLELILQQVGIHKQ
jgi:creatinine amidohydrolase